MGIALKVRLLEFFLSLPLSACIVSVVWFGFMQNFFSVPLAQSDEAISQGLPGWQELPSAVAPQLPDVAFRAVDGKEVSTVVEDPRVFLLEEKIHSIMSGNSTRMRFGSVMQQLGLKGPAIETGLGANRGKFAEQVLRDWSTPKYYMVDPTPSSSTDGSPAMQRMLWEGRVEMVDDYVEDAASRFPNDHFSFVYINPTRLRKALEDWFPKVKDGGIIAGKDYCASSSQKSSPEFGKSLINRPWCGTYHGGSKTGKDKAGFGRYIQAVDVFAEEVGRSIHFTLEGRDPNSPCESDGYANPSWWMVK